MATTEQLMAQHGVAWFGFDEASGNVYDKLGDDYVGIVTTSTRAQGWNGKGSSLNVRGSSGYVLFNSGVIPINEKTIRFKLKMNNSITTAQIIMSNSLWNWGTDSGIDIYMENNTLKFRGRNGSNQGVYGLSVLIKNPQKWNDIIISVNGSSNQPLGLYVNGELKRTAQQNGTMTTSSGSLVLGQTWNTSYRYYGDFQIDDLQIYNKALSPSDFTQKRLAVKTTDNKNLVLSSTSTRVKEIPNTAEYMMLAQGGVIKEIDSAVDSQPIDFTKTTTEYEIVTNNRTPLGKGRMFTIPIDSDFKTAMIEDNY